jgi:hypothetical protein
MTCWSRVSSGRVGGRVRGPSPEPGKSWSRQLVRIALACGDSDLADEAVAIAAGSAARESQRLSEVLKEYDEMGAGQAGTWAECAGGWASGATCDGHGSPAAGPG